MTATAAGRRAGVRRWAVLGARLGLAGTWLVAGGAKALDPAGSRVAVAAYEVVPRPLVEPLALGLPLVELAVAGALLVGWRVRAAAAVSALLLAAFVAGIVQAWARGLSIDCGCFGGGGAVAPGTASYLPELVRDAALLVLAVGLAVAARRR